MAPPSAIASSYAVTSSAVAAVVKPTHRYTSEIQAMMFVYASSSSSPSSAAAASPPKELDEDVCQYVEDIVRSQLAEIVSLKSRRGGRFDSTCS